jgi:hypothetical protein
MKKQKKKNPAQHSQSPRGGTTIVGRVNPDFAVFLWGMSDSEVKLAADSISKGIEVTYQMQLIRSSGFGQTDD